MSSIDTTKYLIINKYDWSRDTLDPTLPIKDFLFLLFFFFFTSHNQDERKKKIASN